MKTKVLFLYHKDNDDLFAFFPKKHYFRKNNKFYKTILTCYSHIGQHSGCSLNYANESIEATKEQYINLYGELILIGYDLEVLNDDWNNEL